MAYGLDAFADWIHELTGVPVVLDLGERGSPVPPMPYVTVRELNRTVHRVAAPKATTEDPVTTKYNRNHRVYWQRQVRISVWTDQEGEARQVLDQILNAILFEDGSASLRAKGLAFTPISEIIELGPGTETAFADVNLWSAEDLVDQIYVIEQAECPVTVT